MSIVSARSSRPSRWTAARVSVVWRSFDLQLATYAALLLCFGLAMAYSNSTTSGGGGLRRLVGVPARPDVDRDRGGGLPRRHHRSTTTG